MLSKNERGRWVFEDGRRLRSGHQVQVMIGQKWYDGQARYYGRSHTWGIVVPHVITPPGPELVLALHARLHVRRPAPTPETA